MEVSGARARIQFAAGAREDLRGIYRRRLLQRGADGADGADALLEGIIAAIGDLAEWPVRGAVPHDLEAMGIKDCRQISLTPFRIIYSVKEAADGAIVSILIIADARRDMRVLLEERRLTGR